MQKIGFAEALDSIVATDKRYSREAYVFLRDALDYTTNQPKKTDGAAGQTPESVLTQVIRQYPDVYIVPELADAATVTTLCEEAKDHLVVGSIRAKEAPETLLRVLMLKVPLCWGAALRASIINMRGERSISWTKRMRLA